MMQSFAQGSELAINCGEYKVSMYEMQGYAVVQIF